MSERVTQLHNSSASHFSDHTGEYKNLLKYVHPTLDHHNPSLDHHVQEIYIGGGIDPEVCGSGAVGYNRNF